MDPPGRERKQWFLLPIEEEHSINIEDETTDSDQPFSDDDHAVNIQEPAFPDNIIGNKEDYFNLVLPLFESSLMGDWGSAKHIFNKHPNLVRCGLTKDLNTALHVVASAFETNHTLNFVQNLVNMMTHEDLEIKNNNSNTAFWIASSSGNLEMAKIMLKKNRNLVDVRGNGCLPLTIGATRGTRDIAKWLYDNSQRMTSDLWTDDDKTMTLLACAQRDFFDLALKIVKEHPDQVARGNNVFLLLPFLAQQPYAFRNIEKNLIMRIIEPSCRFFGIDIQTKVEEDNTEALKLLEILWKHATRTMSFNEIEGMLTQHSASYPYGVRLQHSGILFLAVENGNTRFIIKLLRTYPDLMFTKRLDGLTIFHVAVMHRHEGIYNLLYEIDSFRTNICLTVDYMENNMLHLVGKSSKEMAAKTSKASLLMQRELLWFNEISNIIPPTMVLERNKDGLTPYELFSQENEGLVSQGLKWMKDCMVVATLIVTVAFAAAFTVPGGYNGDNGFPFFLSEPSFIIFIISDAISLFSSSTSLLVFLSVLTSRQEQQDFIRLLPCKLMIGLLTLLISVATMMVAFSASFFVLYHKGLRWVPILIAAFAAIPVIVFARLQFPLLVDMFRSMYDSHYLFGPKKRILYPKKHVPSPTTSLCWWSMYKSITTKIFFKRH